jgi:hypothetical protein
MLVEMNKAQWSMFASALVILLAAILFPSWLYKCANGFSYSAGYHFIAAPPASMNVCPSSNPLPEPLPSVVRNGDRQTVQVIIVILLASGLLLLLKTPKTKGSVVLAILVIYTGIIGLFYLALMIKFEM